MEQKDFVLFIQEITEKYPNVLFHPEIIPEFQKYVFGSGFEVRFFKQLIKNLDALTSLGYKAVHLDNFEKLKQANGLWSMKFKSDEYNLRIYYSLVGKDKWVLHLFEEKQGKKRTSYESHTPIAKERKKAMEESLNEY